ncbi:MAG: glycosyl hydrolase [Bacteroidia bacterium]|nr:glycosyl hydrolase [Bacteroidia bacterium]
MKHIILIITSFLITIHLPAQNPVSPTSSKERQEGWLRKKQLAENTLLGNIPLKNIGPTIMSGRVTDIDVNPDDPTHFYVAYASGGLWKTENNGTSFHPVFDHELVITIGDIAVDWKHGEVIWVGTGECNSSRSSYSGMGVFVSRDKGKTWTSAGLEETHHISRIITDPDDPNSVYVAAVGHLYSPNTERGVFKTTDGGKTWKKTLYIDDNTGAIDLVLQPGNSKIIYASSWQRTRRAWNFEESGKGSGIWRSSDGGQTWKKVSGGNSGFPDGDGVGRIGLAATSGGIVYAFLDNQFQSPPKEKGKEEKITRDLLRTITAADFEKLSNDDLEKFLRENDFPEKHKAKSVKESVRNGKLKPIALVEYLEDANSLLFNTKITGAELYRSDDGGQSWKKTHNGALDGMYYTYGYYFGNIRVADTDPEKVYLVGFVILYSKDGGKTFTSLNRDNTHVDYHALELDPKKTGHLICGNDGGVNISYDNGETWIKCNSPAVGQFYSVNYDFNTPYNVYGGLQDNGVWYGPSTYKYSPAWHQEGEYPYKSLMGGDGMQVMTDPRNNNTVYTGYQFGNYFRIDKTTRDAVYITPVHELGERPYRWNWESPIWLSVHNPDILYMGSNRFHRSFNQGKDFQTLSPDLTAGGKKGDVSFGTLTTLHESPLRFGLIYTGSDDGLVHVSKDGGYTWTRIVNGLPANMWVSQVWASSHKESRVYCSLSGYRWDHFVPYVYVSEDYGTTWKRLGAGLPAEPVNVVKDDPANEKIIYIGTDNGFYVSLDGGNVFMSMMNGLPHVAVHDLAIHPVAKEVILATHGRSLYTADVSILQQLNDSLMALPLRIFSIAGTRWRPQWGKIPNVYDTPDTPLVHIPFWSKEKTTVNWEIFADSITRISGSTQTCARGINYITYDLTFPESSKEIYISWLMKKSKNGTAPEKSENGKWYLRPGRYTLVITDVVSGKSTTSIFEITDVRKKE